MRSISNLVDNLLKCVWVRRRPSSKNFNFECPLTFADILAASTCPQLTNISLERVRRKLDIEIADITNSTEGASRQKNTEEQDEKKAGLASIDTKSASNRPSDFKSEYPRAEVSTTSVNVKLLLPPRRGRGDFPGS
jgi:hypothetical protein